MYVLIGISCKDCDRNAIQILENEYTKEDVEKMRELLGGMYCITYHCIEINIGEIKEFDDECFITQG